MIEVLLSSLTLSVIHAMIPNHWIPIITVAKAEHWSMRESILITGITGVAHSLGTIAIGIGLGYIGLRLTEQFEIFAELIAPLILIIIGLVYLSLSTQHQHSHFPKELDQKRSKVAIILALALSMFLSPCLEMESYFIVAASKGWIGVWITSLVFLISTTTVMMLLVWMGYSSLERIKWDFLERHEKKISGAVLLIIGGLTLLYPH